MEQLTIPTLSEREAVATHIDRARRAIADARRARIDIDAMASRIARNVAAPIVHDYAAVLPYIADEPIRK